MGVFGQLKNKKKTDKQRKAMKWRRGQRQVAKKKETTFQLNAEDVQLFSKDMLKNKMKNVKNNVTISNKKKNRLLKRLRHGQREKEAAKADTDVQMDDEVPAKGKKGKGKGKKSKTEAASSSTTQDVDDDVNMEADGQ